MRIKKLRDVQTPKRSTDKAAGIDFFIPNDWEKESVTLQPNEDILIHSGIKVEVPEGMALIGFNKSGKAVKKALQLGACVIDEDYQGEIMIHIRNIGYASTMIFKGEKIAQYILIPIRHDGIEVVEGELFKEKTIRGVGGFGHTGE